MLAENWKDTNPKDAIGSRKPRWFSYLPLRALIGPGLACLEGALKYARHNYREAGVRASVYVDATVNGHLVPFWEGQDIDPASGLHHVDKAIASLLVMRDSMLEGNWVDDRPPAAKGLEQLLALAERQAGELIDKYPNPPAPFTEARRRREAADFLEREAPKLTIGGKSPSEFVASAPAAGESLRLVPRQVAESAPAPHAAIDRGAEFRRAYNLPMRMTPGLPMTRREEELASGLIQEELDELKTASAEGNLVEIFDALLDLDYVVHQAVLVYGLGGHWETGRAEVHRSNMSKLGEDGKPIRDGRGKVVKGPSYSPPDLAKVLAAS